MDKSAIAPSDLPALGRINPDLLRQWIERMNEVLSIGHGRVTVVVQGGRSLLQPTPSIGPFDPVEVEDEAQ